MQPPGFGVNQGWQRVHIRALQFGKLAVLNNWGNHHVLVFQALQHFNVGAKRARAGFGLDWELKFAEQHIPQLFWRVDVELLTRQLVNFFFQMAQPLVDLARKLREIFHIQRHAVKFHIQQNGDERKLHVVKQRLLIFGAQLRLLRLPKLKVASASAAA